MESNCETVLNMEPGEELDAIVAEVIFDRLVTWNRTFMYLTDEEKKHRNESFITIPEYSTNIASAWEVVEKFKGFVSVQKHANGKFTARVPDGTTRWLAVTSNSAAECICKVCVISYLKRGLKHYYVPTESA